MLSTARRIAGSVKRRLFPQPDVDAFLSNCSGVIHVGANTGQERDLYASRRLPVVWIEPIDEQFAELKENIRGLPAQMAIQALITDRDGDQRTLHISNNDGLSSSILDLHMHKDIWPDIHFARDVTMATQTLGKALSRANVNPRFYDALVLDTQGSELIVLRGATPLLCGIKFIKTEAADFEAYRGCATVSQITEFLRQHGFRLSIKQKFTHHPNGRGYFDVLYVR